MSKKTQHMEYPCATIKTEFAIQQNETCFMDSGSNMKPVIFLCNIWTSCDGRLKLALLTLLTGAALSAEFPQHEKYRLDKHFYCSTCSTCWNSEVWEISQQRPTRETMCVCTHSVCSDNAECDSHVCDWSPLDDCWWVMFASWKDGETKAPLHRCVKEWELKCRSVVCGCLELFCCHVVGQSVLFLALKKEASIVIMFFFFLQESLWLMWNVSLVVIHSMT